MSKFIRGKYLTARKGLSKDIVKKKSKLIVKKLLGLEAIKNAKTVSAYLPVNNEVDTYSIIDYLLGAGKTVAVPGFVDRNYYFGKLNNLNNLELGPSKILQPRVFKRIDPKLVDVAIIPGVAFDQKGNRLGYGKGVFDKLLCCSDAFKVGLAFEFQIIDNLTIESHDIKMDVVVSEKKVYRF